MRDLTNIDNMKIKIYRVTYLASHYFLNEIPKQFQDYTNIASKEVSVSLLYDNMPKYNNLSELLEDIYKHLEMIEEIEKQIKTVQGDK